IKAGADWISVHPDTCANPKATLEKIRELGAKASIAVNPDVAIKKVEGGFASVGMVVMMTVFPGFGGQAFIPDLLPKIAEVRKWIDGHSAAMLVEVDGGIKADNIDRVREAGGEVIVSGSGIFKTPDYSETIRRMRQAVD